MSSLRSILNPDETSASPRRPEKATSPSSSSLSLSRSHSGTPTSEHPPSRPQAHDDEHSPHPDCPDTLDCLPDTHGRPQHTLPVILRCAILGSPKRRLTIRDIYAAMENKYAYYKTAGPTWKQSVRHHLSLNRLFEREPRPVTEPGFGSYWTVNLAAPPGTKRPRKRGRANKADAEADAQGKKRGRPKKAGDDMAMDADIDHPPIATLSTDATGSSWRARPRRRGHDPAMRSDLSDEDEISEGDEPMEETRANGSEDERFDSEDEQEGCDWTSNVNPYTLVPTAKNPSDRDGGSPTKQVVENLQNQISDLKRQTSIAATVSARMSDQLAEAQADVAKYRFENEVLERRLENERARRVKAEAALVECKQQEGS